MSKKALSQQVFNEMVAAGKDPLTEKADFISRYVSEVNMTPAGANTYFLGHRKQHIGGVIIVPSSEPTIRTPKQSHPISQFESKANSGSNIDGRQMYAIAYPGDDDTVSNMECGFNLGDLRTRSTQFEGECKLIKGIGKEEMSDNSYKSLKSIS